GPNRDGTVSTFTAPKTWPKTLKEQWKVRVGEGHSSPVVVDGKVYQLARQKDAEVILCLDLATGKEIWRDSYDAPYKMHFAATGHGKGPKSTPTVHGGKVYALGISGILSCLDARTGKVLWRKDFAKQYSATSPLYGAAMSPLVDSGLCIVHVGGHDKGALTAFDAHTGEVKWSWTGDGPGYASPVLATLLGERRVMTQTQKSLLGVSAATGKVLWKVPFTTAYDQNSVTPLVTRDRVIFSGYAQPLTAVRLEKKGEEITAKTAWSNP